MSTEISKEARESAGNINDIVSRWMTPFQPCSEVEGIIQKAIDAATAELREQFGANEANIKRVLGKSPMSYPAINAAVEAAGEIKELRQENDKLKGDCQAWSAIYLALKQERDALANRQFHAYNNPISPYL